MSAVDGMLATLLIVILMMNAVVLSFTFLPNKVDGTGNYTFGMSALQLTQLNASIGSVSTDTNGATAGITRTTAATTRITGIDIVDSILLGIGDVVTSAAGVIGGVFSLLGWILKYLPFFIFGWYFWIDYFLGGLYTLTGIGGFFLTLGVGLKVLFSVIYIVGFIRIIIPIFQGSKIGV